MVSSDQRRRQLARQKFERQRQRREEARRKARRRNAVIAAALAVVVAAGATAYAVSAIGGDDGPDPAAQPPAASESPAPSESSSPEPKLAVDTKADYTMKLATDRGDIAIAMQAAKTPRTVNSFQHLAGKKFFDGTPCHRLTTEGIFVLQCGDPTGDGSGGPGYNIPDENLASLGKPGKDGKALFKAGTVAMANTGQPDSGGSQFFLVYKDTKLPPQYTPFGTMDAAGLKAVRKIAEAGTADGQSDGAPKTPVTVEKATVSKG
ncbi:peptidylprolyl isomerase [Streptomyces solincola]|uniref:Peptidylprolyl isomerase n=1 Tax=Streptomyces solincola TaxID=2100817 RepID=A0A2S9PRD5_9ACTN|nr:peptidylprolyl isomerase [Streptomyces solincola]PRH76961.1 peptidylprolyl isomerase [Streptomyces solincola]